MQTSLDRQRVPRNLDWRMHANVDFLWILQISGLIW